MEGQLDPGAELISVSVEGQLYAIDIMAVREIRGWTAATTMPHAPAHVLGMINLRGVVLPVVSLGARLGLGASRTTPTSVVVVVQLADRQVGLLVDAVCDIIHANSASLQETPEVGGVETREVVRAVMTTPEGIISLLSLDALLPETALAA